MQEARAEVHFCKPGTIPAVVKVLSYSALEKLQQYKDVPENPKTQRTFHKYS